MRMGVSLALTEPRRGSSGVAAPSNSVAPVISGTTVQGQTLSTTNGTWTGSPSGYTYQWKRAGASIGGATSSTYVLTSSDVGSSIVCTVTATNAGGSTAADSNSLGPVTDFTAYTGQVATRSFVPNAFSAEAQYMGRTRMVLTDAVSSIKVVFPAWCVAVSSFIGTDTDTSGNMTIKCSVEVGGVNLGAVTWSAASSVTATPGQTVVSDSFALGSTLAAGTAVFLRTYITKTGGGIPRNEPSQSPSMFDASNGEISEYGATVTDRTASTGTWTGNSQYATYPCAVIGSTTKPTFFCSGDSRTASVGDTPNANGDAGEAPRLVGAGGYGYINAGVGSNSVKTWVSKSPYVRGLLQYCTHVTTGMAANDIRTGGLGLTAVETEGWTRNMWDAVGVARPIIGFTSAPQTTSSDNWATTGNQTLNGNASELISFNQWLRGLPNGLDAVIDASTAVSSAQDSGKWKVDGTASKYTADGLHETPAGYGLVQAIGGASTLAALRSTRWTPMALMPIVGSNLYGVWVDQLEYASRTSGLANGNSVSSWGSRSSGGAFSQTGTNRPTVSSASINGIDAFNFASASTQYMPGSGASTLQAMLNGMNGCLMWAVIRPQSIASFGTILESRNGAGTIRAALILNVSTLRFATVTRRSDADASVTTNGGTTLSTSTNYYVVAYVDASTNTTTLWLNGVQDGVGTVGTGSGTFQATSGVATLGGSSSGTALYNGLIAEAGCAPTSSTFSAGQISALNAYLAAKYGI